MRWIYILKQLEESQVIMDKTKLEQLSKDELKRIIIEVSNLLSAEQKNKLNKIISNGNEITKKSNQMKSRMSRQQVNKKMEEIHEVEEQIDNAELIIYSEGYEDYTNGFWESEWITNYYDEDGIGDMIMVMIRFAKECVNDGWYQEANEIYEWLWQMDIFTQDEWEDPIGLEQLEENNIISVDLKDMALMTLYADYQSLSKEKRAEDIYLYINISPFCELHIEDMFYVGREQLEDAERFWQDWIHLLMTKKGDVEGRLLKEAVLYVEGLDGLFRLAVKNSDVHPTLYFDLMEEYEKEHDYKKMEEIGDQALLIIKEDEELRNKIALRSAFAASNLGHEEKMMQFCWESFCAKPNSENYLRLFGTEKMAKLYGQRGKEILNKIKGDHSYYILCFYTGDFETVRHTSINPQGSLGWSTSFIQYGLRAILLYLYEDTKMIEAVSEIAEYLDSFRKLDYDHAMKFEWEILEESQENHCTIFWVYFQKWKKYYKMSLEQQERYLSWAEEIVYKRADAIVSGQHRRQYGQVAALLAMIAEIKKEKNIIEDSKELYYRYKKKFPRHSAFQAEMKRYFEM